MAEREYRIQAPDGSVLKIVGPVDATPDQLRGAAERAFAARQAAPVTPPGQIPVDNRVQAPAAVPTEVPMGRRVVQTLGDVGAGMVRGAGSIGATLIAPIDIAKDALAGKDLSLESNRQRRKDMTDALRMLGADTDSTAFAGGRLASEVAGTAGVGGGLAKAAAPVANIAPRFVAALPSAGFVGSSLPARLAAGATVGGVSAGALNPDDVVTGAALGAGLSAAAPTISRVIGSVAGKVVNAPNMAQAKANRLAAAAAGPDLADIRSALNAAEGRTVTVNQATAGINNPTWQALAAEAAKRDPRAFNQIIAAQQDESLNALAGLAKGDTAAATRATVEQARKNLNTITGPMREEALKRANVAASASGDAAAALEKAGFRPLKSDTVTAELGKVLSRPEYAGNDIMEGAVRNVAQDIAKWTEKNTGVIPAEALDAIRRNAVNAAVAKLRPGLDATAQRNAASGVLSQIKPLIDEAIEKAGGTGYKQYLARHAEGMQKIAEQKLTGEALRMWKTDKEGFLRLVNNESPEMVEKILGPGNYDIAKNLAADSLGVLKGEAAKIVRDKAVASQSAQGREALELLLQQNKSRLKIVNWLNPAVTAMNKGLDILERNLDAKTMQILAEAMKSPKGAKDLLAAVPPSERSKILKILNNPETWGSTGQAVRSGVNALAVSDEPTE